MVQESSSSFWPAFWPNFFADLLVGVIIAGAIKWVIDRSKSVRLSVVAIHQEEQGKLKFAISNTGKTSFMKDEIYWHIFVPKSLLQNPQNKKYILQEIDIGGTAFVEYTKIIDSPLFPGARLVVMDIESGNRNDFPEFYYYLSTSRGFFPKSLQFHGDGRASEYSLGNVVATKH